MWTPLLIAIFGLVCGIAAVAIAWRASLSGIVGPIRGYLAIVLALAVMAAVSVGVVATGLQFEQSKTIENVGPSADTTDKDLARLNQYLGSVPAKTNPAMSPAPNLPDVDTMIAKLAARLKSRPDDVDGWRMLGWSYRHTGKLALAVVAYERAAGLAPGRADLVEALKEARQAAGISKPEP
jgi:cytochrome c-type biogenesis protein CcmH/NrfG